VCRTSRWPPNNRMVDLYVEQDVPLASRSLSAGSSANSGPVYRDGESRPRSIAVTEAPRWKEDLSNLLSVPLSRETQNGNHDGHMLLS